jgi:lipoprotein-anchoring transpeptidase ErfK/SrfK
MNSRRFSLRGTEMSMGIGTEHGEAGVRRRPRLGLSAGRSLAVFLALVAGVAAMPAPSQARELVALEAEHPAGTIIVDTAQRRLYYVLGHGMALRYAVAVG